tara:strand:- start:132 stop:404 length:273 start_codon:yes stop_codon:yes gene_type:complete
MSSQQTNITITIQQLNTLLSGVIVAQKRGIYSFEESGVLAEPVKIVSQFIKVHTDNEEHAKLEQNKTTKTHVNTPSTIIEEDDLTLKNLI